MSNNKKIAHIPTTFASSVKWLDEMPVSLVLLHAMMKAGSVNPEVGVLMQTNLATIIRSIVPFFPKHFTDSRLNFVLAFGETESTAFLTIEPKDDPHDFSLTGLVEFKLNDEGYILHIAKFTNTVEVRLS